MLKSIIIAFSMYSKIPMPQVEWDAHGKNFSLCFFPLVGAVIGLCSIGIFFGLPYLGMGKTITAAVLTVLPILLNGGIHMDGFLDTMDAKHSYQPKERKLEILKDPHMGAFAAICGLVYMFLTFGFFSETSEETICLAALGYVYSRILSGLSVVSLKKAKKDGMAAEEADTAQKQVKGVLWGELLVCIVCFFLLNPVIGAVCAAIGGLCFGHYRRMAYKLFGGITGDLAGYFLQLCELWILIGAVLAERLWNVLAG